MFKEQKALSFLTGAVLVMLFFFLGVKAWNGFAEHDAIGRQPLQRDTITIDGEGKITSPPTIGRADLGVYSEAKDAASAQKDNAEKMNAIQSAMQKLGIKKEDMQTSGYHVGPKYDWTRGQVITGYTVSQTLNVKIRDLNKVGEVLAQAGALGANQVNGVQFSIEDPAAAKQEARKKAIEDARAKANELAKSLGLKVARVVNFTEHTNDMPRPYPYMMDAVATKESAAPMAPDIQPGTTDIVSNVSVTFEIQ
ncbi:SIMPL domain-containing protein [Candidatus Uhrbacteria bacterium]|nr:SIMPL domain-containing protein [Candidatus Uhrbacteria bacterium]